MQRPGLPPSIKSVIAKGPNAGQRKPITDILIDRLRSALYVSCGLKARGYTVLDVALMDHHMPVVKVEPDRRTAEMLETRNARYITDGCNQLGRHRVGQFEVDGVAVQWEEWGCN